METGDRISELYKGEIFAAETQAIARQRIDWMCRHVVGRKVLDIGCSQGIVSILLAREGFQVIGVDTDAEAIEYANSDKAKEPPDVQQRLTFIRGDICDVDLPDRGFDSAIMGEFLEHLERPEKAVDRTYRLLADGGKLVVTAPLGLLEDPGHKQTFYVASLYKLMYSYFAISEMETIGRYLCFVCRKRESVLEEQMPYLDMALAERAEREFLQREVALTEERDARREEAQQFRGELNVSRAEAAHLRAELAKEQRTLRVLRASLSFQLGSLLVQGLRRASRDTVLLPYRVLRIGVRALRKQPLAPPAGPVAKKADVLEIVKAKANEIRQEIGSTSGHPIGRRTNGLKIAVIMDDIFYELFKYEANLITFTPENWEQVLSEGRPDLLLVDSAWQGNGGTWRYQIDNLGQRLPSQLPELLAWCRARNIRTAFWNREDSLHYEEFVDAARLFDYVFTTDADCIERYKKDLARDNVFCLTFAAQPRIHNPVGSSRKIRNVGFAGSWYAEGHDDRVRQMKYVLKPALAYDVDIFDRNFSRNAPQFRFPAKYQPNILGELTYDEMVYAYKMYKVFLNVNSVPESPTMFAMRVPEILASGTCVLSSYARGIENLMGSDVVKMTSSSEETKAQLDLLLSDKELRDRLAHLGLRKVMKEHTYEKRLDYILEVVGLGRSSNDAKKKGVSIIACTKKLVHMDNVFANYCRQEYEDKELIIILNDNRLTLEEWREKAKSYPNVAVYRIDEKERLGTCLNYGIEKARFDYISKFDSGAYYAPAFLTDLMNAFEYTDAAIVGKCGHYTYFEDKDTLLLQFEDKEHCYTDFVDGSAMIVKRKVFDRVRFPSDMLARQETEFFEESVSKGVRIYSADRFNYVSKRRVSEELGAPRVQDEERSAPGRIVAGVKDYATYVTC